MTVQYYLTYCAVVFLATVSPGPSMLLAITHGIQYGARRTIPSALGNVLGNLLMAFVSLAGLRAILMTYGVLFAAIKWAGIGYLVFIGIRLFCAPPLSDDALGTGAPSPRAMRTITRTTLFREGLWIAIANPKGILFFTALFPQFITITTASGKEFVVLFATLAVIAFIGFVLYGAAASRLRLLFHVPWFRTSYNRVAGTAFVSAGLAMARDTAHA